MGQGGHIWNAGVGLAKGGHTELGLEEAPVYDHAEALLKRKLGKSLASRRQTIPIDVDQMGMRMMGDTNRPSNS